MSNPKISIYTLSDPTTGAIRYVGYTSKTVEERARAHKASKLNSGVSQWVFDLSGLGLEPVCSVIEVVEWDDRHTAEQKHIKRLASEGHDLLNKHGNPNRKHRVKYWGVWWKKERRRTEKLQIQKRKYV